MVGGDPWGQRGPAGSGQQELKVERVRLELWGVAGVRVMAPVHCE